MAWDGGSAAGAGFRHRTEEAPNKRQVSSACIPLSPEIRGGFVQGFPNRKTAAAGALGRRLLAWNYGGVTGCSRNNIGCNRLTVAGAIRPFTCKVLTAEAGAQLATSTSLTTSGLKYTSTPV